MIKKFIGITVIIIISTSIIFVSAHNIKDENINNEKIILYSFEKDSFSLEKLCKSSCDILYKNNPGHYIKTFFSIDKDITSLSRNVKIPKIFSFVFSVDGNSKGNILPNERFGIHNVKEQYQLNQQSGDAYFSTQFYMMNGVYYNDFNNNVLYINNFDEGGRDFAGDGPSASKKINFQDNINAFDTTDGNTLPIYFTVSSSPYEIYVIKPDFKISYFTTLNHEIDGLIVSDRNDNYIFDRNDILFISIKESSDIYLIKSDSTTEIFTTSYNLGLDNHDEINALSLLSVDENDDVVSFSQKYGIN